MINTGLIGAGGFGASHMRNLLDSGDENGLKLVAVADPTELPAPATARLEQRGIHRYKEYREMFASEDLQAVIIATPVPLHFDMTRDALEAGLWVYLEKPPVPLHSEWQELVEIDRDERVTVGFHMIGWPPYHLIKNSLLDGRLGEIQEIRAAACWPRRSSYYGRASWAGQVALNGRAVLDGPATNALSHLLHLACYLSGESFEETARPAKITGEFYRSRNIPSYDSALIRGELEQGTALHFALTHSVAPPQSQSFQIFGSKGRLWTDETLGFQSDDTQFSAEINALVRNSNSKPSVYWSQKDFAALIRGERERSRVSLRDCEGFLLLLNGGLASSDGIHAVDEKYLSEVGEEEEVVIDTEGMREAVEEFGRTGTTFIDQGRPWAVSGREVSASEAAGFSIDELLVPAR